MCLILILLFLINGKWAYAKEENIVETSSVKEIQVENLSCENLIYENNYYEKSIPIILGIELEKNCSRMNKKYKYCLSSEEKLMLEKIVESEASGEDRKGKILVANVIFNRLEHNSFPNNVEDIIFQKEKGVWQFSPIYDGRYNKVVVTEDTREAVEEAMLGHDYSNGALFFMSRKNISAKKAEWFDSKLTKLFAYGGHEFFK